MGKGGSYSVRLSKIVSGGLRNIDSYYLLLRDAHNLKFISKSMRNDEDNQDELLPPVDFQPVLLEVYNYDKMVLVQKYKVDFKLHLSYQWNIYQENLEIHIEYISLQPKVIQSNENNSSISSIKQIENSGASPEKSKLTSLKSQKTSGVKRPPLPPKKEEPSQVSEVRQ